MYMPVTLQRCVAGLAVATALLAIVMPATAAAQTVTETTGAATGTVVDTTQGRLPGVSVTLTGSAVSGARTTVTSEDGTYRFSGLAPGDYTLTFELVGFGTVIREGIRIGAAFTATVNTELKPGGVQETVTVSGVSPVVDTQSAAITTRLEASAIEALGGSRDFWSVMATLPAVSMRQMDVGGSGVLRQQPYTAYGLTPSQATAAINRNEVEGIRAGAANGTASDFYYADMNSFEEVAVTAVGQTASSPVAGTFTRLISKSGSNTYRGTVYLDYQNKNLQAHNIDQDQIDAGLASSNPDFDVQDLNRTDYLRDMSADVGGFILRDKLWWYGAYRRTAQAQGFPFFDGLQENFATIYTIKGTYNISPSQKFSGYRQAANKTTEDYFLATSTFFDSTGSVPSNDFPTYVWKVEYNKTFNAMFLEIRTGAYGGNFLTFPKNNDPRIEDVGTRIRSGSNAAGGLPRSHPQVNTSLSYFKDGWGGSHNFKVGGEFRRDELENLFGGQPHPCSCTSTLNNGTPTQVRVFRGENVSESSIDSLGLYAEDQWQVGSRFTLSYGLRLDRYQPFLPEQTGPDGVQFARVAPLLTWNNWGPRAGFSFDLTGDAKTVLKASYGQYFAYPSVYLAQAVNPNQSGWYTDYQWLVDRNGNGYWDSGEEGRQIGASGGTSTTAFDPDLKNPRIRQAAAFVEREIVANFGVRAGFVWNGERDAHRTVNANRPLVDYTVEIPVRDPGPDGSVGTTDDGEMITAYELNAEALSRPVLNLTKNLPLDQDHFTWEIAGTRRQTGRWSLMGSFAYTRSHLAALSGGTGFTPNSLINTNDGDRLLQTSWQAKINSSIDLPWAFRIVPMLRYQSGDQVARTFVRNLVSGAATIRAETFGAQRKPNIALIDIRSEKNVLIFGRRLTGFFDVYNVFNNNAEQDLTFASGASYLRPTLVTSPRVARFGVKFQW
jgi:hypothetical protein